MKRMVMMQFLILGMFLISVLSSTSFVFADTTTSTVSGEVVSGKFSMSKPNDLTFRTTLNGSQQLLTLNPLRIKITDYRGIEEGWQLTVKSSNFDSYGHNYQLIINDQSISRSEKLVYSISKQNIVKEIHLPVKARISSQAKAGSYEATLEWNLQPNIENLIKE
ncbi:hypothetical protein ACRPK2_10630 [Lactococcus garvieae]|uniref:hypothetical protein n=1 Tax=Lactococcus garvieae TaxID=1363 RepID=UPI003D773D4A